VFDPMPTIEKPLKSKKMKDVVPEWYANYVDIPRDDLYKIISTSNRLDIQPLFDLGCAKFASMCMEKTLPELKAIFDITDDFTPEEEAVVRAENNWTQE
jgi:S-phase kinase-associated protein 1